MDHPSTRKRWFPPMDREAFARAYGRFVRPARWTETRRFYAHERHDVCSPGCAVFEAAQNLYFCEHSGNYHVCTPLACEFAHESAGNVVCTLTGKYMGVRTTDATDADERAEFETHRPSAMTKNMSMFPSSLVESARIMVEEQKHAWDEPEIVQKTTVTGKLQFKRLPVAARLSDPATRASRMRKFAKVIVRELVVGGAPAERVDPKGEEVVECVELCEITWNYVVHSRPFEEHPFGFNLEYHALVVIYLAREGWKDIVPVVPLLRDFLPKRDNNTVAGRYALSSVTRTHANFIRCINDLEQRGLV